MVEKPKLTIAIREKTPEISRGLERELLEKLATRHQVEFVEVKDSSAEALEELQKTNPDIILIGVQPSSFITEMAVLKSLIDSCECPALIYSTADFIFKQLRAGGIQFGSKIDSVTLDNIEKIVQKINHLVYRENR